MTEEQMMAIENSEVFVCLVPEGGVDGHKIEDELRYALALDKPIVVWVLPDRVNIPPPRALEGKTAWTVVGDYKAAAAKVQEIIRGV